MSPGDVGPRDGRVRRRRPVTRDGPGGGLSRDGPGHERLLTATRSQRTRPVHERDDEQESGGLRPIGGTGFPQVGRTVLTGHVVTAQEGAS